MKAAALIVLLLSYVIFAEAQSGSVFVTSSATFDKVDSQNTNYLWFCGFGSYPTCDSSNQIYTCPSAPNCAGRQVRWGRGTNGIPSGCGYDGLTNQQVTFNGVRNLFACGYLTHYNNPIYSGTGATAFNVNLRISMSGAFSFSQDFTFRIQVDETPNSEPCTYPSSTPCADKLSFDPNVGITDPTTFTVSDNVYTVAMLGFRESLQDTSSPGPFISQERLSTTKVLVAQVLQCPRICAGGPDQYKIVTNPDGSVSCVCDCTGVTCQSPKVLAPSCACTCPSNICNGGQFDANCQCTSCSGVMCPNNLVPDVTNFCICGCNPNTNCNGGNLQRSGDQCVCNCANLGPCPQGNNYIRDSSCNCVCDTQTVQAQCTGGKTFNPSTCSCQCSNTCPAGFTLNPDTCACECRISCNNAPVDTTTCKCGPCYNEWQGTNCDQCTLTNADCAQQGQNLVVDTSVCACRCTSGVTCTGSTPIFVPPCGCRACVGIECCGNGKLDEGEQCDPTAPSNGAYDTQCCTDQCTLRTGDCDDGNKCTTGDTCASGFCRGNPKICPSDALCSFGSCDTNTGLCVNVSRADKSPCGSDPPEGVCTRQCIGGQCSYTTPITCEQPQLPAGLGPDPCNKAICGVTNDGTVGCVVVPTTDGTPCNDGDPCTTDDKCSAGKCAGTYKCPETTNPCAQSTCTGAGDCIEVALPNARLVPCDDGDPCTTGDHCTTKMECVGAAPTCGTDDICYNVTCAASSDGKTALCSYSVAVGLPCDIYKKPDPNNPTAQPQIDPCRVGKCRVDPKSSDGRGYCADTGENPDCNSESGGAAQQTGATIGLAVGGSAAVAGAAGAAAFVARRIRKKRLLDPESWSPASLDMGSSNPLYNQKKTENFNELYEVRSH